VVSGNDAWLSTRGYSKVKAWRADDVGPESSWRCPLPPRCADELVVLARELAEGPTPLVETRLSAAQRADWARDWAPIAEVLKSGRGFAIVEGPAHESLTPEARVALYWVVGQLLGEPVAQNVQGVRLYDVRDTGQSISQGARFSVTNLESSFHTDGAFMDDVIDVVGLLCLNAARSGGLSQLVSGYSVTAVLRATAPAALAALARPFHIDRRGGVRPGEPPTLRRPALSDEGDSLLFSYLRTWVDAGHAKAGEPLSDEQTRALDALDGALNRPDLRAEFLLRPGDMLFLNNRWILHNRTAFEDYPEPERRRHAVRLWLRTNATPLGRG
jgi:hypothetical protein